MTVLNILGQLDINTESKKLCTTSDILIPCEGSNPLSYVSSRVVPWASAFMKLLTFFRIRSKPLTELEEQIEYYKHNSKRGKAWPLAIKTDCEYLSKLPLVSGAKNVTEIRDEDYEKFRKYFRDEYSSVFFYKRSQTAIRCFMSFYRKKGYPVLMPSEMR